MGLEDSIFDIAWAFMVGGSGGAPRELVPSQRGWRLGRAEPKPFCLVRVRVG